MFGLYVYSKTRGLQFLPVLMEDVVELVELHPNTIYFVGLGGMHFFENSSF